MGEPLAETVGIWYSKLFFKKLRPVVNTYFQTETREGLLHLQNIIKKQHQHLERSASQ